MRYFIFTDTQRLRYMDPIVGRKLELVRGVFVSDLPDLYMYPPTSIGSSGWYKERGKELKVKQRL